MVASKSPRIALTYGSRPTSAVRFGAGRRQHERAVPLLDVIGVAQRDPAAVEPSVVETVDEARSAVGTGRGPGQRALAAQRVRLGGSRRTPVILGSPVEQGEADRRPQEQQRERGEQRHHRPVSPGPLPQLDPRPGPVRMDDSAFQVSAQLLAQLACARIAVLASARHRALADRDELLGGVARDACKRRRSAVAHRVEQLGPSRLPVARPRVGCGACEKVVEDRAEAVDVRAPVDEVQAAFGLLGRHVRGRGRRPDRPATAGGSRVRRARARCVTRRRRTSPTSSRRPGHAHRRRRRARRCAQGPSPTRRSPRPRRP